MCNAKIVVIKGIANVYFGKRRYLMSSIAKTVKNQTESHGVNKVQL